MLESVTGTSNCEAGAVLSEEIPQQFGLESGCACAAKSLALPVFALIGQPGAHEWCAAAPLGRQAADSIADAARRLASTRAAAILR
jgi:hypothetical protein